MRKSLALGLLLLSASATAGDLNADGAVDGADLDVMKAAFYSKDARADLNRDGIVNFGDLAILKAAMSGAPAPAPMVAPNMSLLPATQTVPPGTVTLELWMDFTEDPTLGGGTDTFFVPARLTFVDFEFDPTLGDDPDFRREPTLESPGVLTSLAFGHFNGLTGPSRVGTFTFTAANVAGPTTLTMNADIDGIAGPFVSLTTFEPMTVVFNSATVTVGAPDISAPTSLNFGNVRQGQTESQVLTVTNNGSQVLTTGVVGTGNPIASPFSITAQTCNNRNLAPAASCTMNVRLTGGASQGAKTDSFAIPSNDPDTPVLTVNVNGTVVPRVSVQPISGITTTTAVCTNQTTGQSANVNLAGATSLNCETTTPPLAIAPGNLVIIQINGTRSAGPMVGGTVRSMGLALVQCQNITTGQNRNFDPAPPGPTPRQWNCLGGGWTATAGQTVRMTVRGNAD